MIKVKISNKSKSSIFLFLIMTLASCSSFASPTTTIIPTDIMETAMSTVKTAVAETQTAIPMGGSILKTAFYAHDGTSQFLIVGNYFSGEEYYRIPIKRIATSAFANSPSWSPDGTYLLFLDSSWAGDKNGLLRVKLLNFHTGQIVTLSEFPAANDIYLNDLYLLRWSYDSKHILYTPTIDEDQSVKVYVSSVEDGKTQKLFSYYNDWLPDNKTLVDYERGATYNIASKEENKIELYAFKQMKIERLFSSLILLTPHQPENIQGFFYPKDLMRQSNWSFENLNKNKVDIVVFDPSVKVLDIRRSITCHEFSDGKIMLSFWGEFTAENITYNKFIVVVDPANLPVVITKHQLLLSTNESVPVLISPDLQFVLLGDQIEDKNRSSLGVSLDARYPPLFVRWQIADMAGNIIRENDQFSQFNILNAPVKYSGGVYNGNGGDHYFDGADFYWQP
jgi:hypothetical protein